MNELIYELSEIQQIANQIVKEFQSKIILFQGDMGAGKTTLIKAIGVALGVESTISSPTFSLVNEYCTKENEIIYHFDFYRLNNEMEALDFGVDDYFYSDNLCFIEWGSKIPNLIPDHFQTISIEIVDESRRRILIN